MDIGWRPGIGDPTFGGWATVFLYVVATLSCLRTTLAMRGARLPVGETFAFWRNVTILFVALGINKQLDLQTLFTEIGRVVARDYGWYGQRADVQIAFIILVGLSALGTVVFMTARLRRAPASTAVTFFGVAFLLAFIFVRAGSFHHIDRFIHTSIFGFQWNWVLEIGGICLVMAGSRSRYARLVRRAKARGDVPALRRHSSAGARTPEG